MADPLSISMALLQTIGTITTIASKVKSFYDAPEELESILNDLAEGQIMVHDIRHHLGNRNPELPHEDKLENRLHEADRVLTQLNNLTRPLLSKPDDATSLRRFPWFKARKKIRKLRDKLAQIHDELPRRLGQVESSRIKLELANVSSAQQQLSDGMLRMETTGEATSRDISKVLEAQERHTQEVRSTQQLHQGINSSVDEIRRGTLRRLEWLESAIAVSHGLRAAPKAPGLLTQGKPQPSDVSEQKASSSTNHTLPSNTEITDSSLQLIYRSFKVETRYRRPNLCSTACRCRCHTPRNIRTPSFLGSVIGQMFVGYKGVPKVALPCTERLCKRNLAPSVLITYFFPSWWIMGRMMLLIARSTANVGPELILRFPRYIPVNSGIIMFAERGNLDALKRSFAQGDGSPNDFVLYKAAKTESLLLFVLRYRQFPVLKYLVDFGATLDIEESDGRIFTHVACRMPFGERGGIPREYQQWATETFLSKHLQDFEFTILHEIVLGFRATKIHEEISRLRAIGSPIDVQDLWGYTPLLWACVRGDIEAVVQLLELGADPDIPNKLDQTPLYMALWSGDVECALHLLSHGANACFATREGWAAFLTAARYSRANPLLVNLLDKLQEMGADVNASLTGVTAVFMAVQENHHCTIEWLLNHGADPKFITTGNATLLQSAAYWGDLRTIKLLRDARLSGIDIHARMDWVNGISFTAMDEMLNPKRPTPASDELIANFVRLLSEVEDRTNGKVPAFDITPVVEISESTASDTAVKASHKVEQMTDSSSEDLTDEEPETFGDAVVVKSSRKFELITDASTEDSSDEDGCFVDSVEVQDDDTATAGVKEDISVKNFDV